MLEWIYNIGQAKVMIQDVINILEKDGNNKMVKDLQEVLELIEMPDEVKFSYGHIHFGPG